MEAGFKESVGMFRELAVPFWMAVALLEHGEWLSTHVRRDEAAPLLEEARHVFERLGARPWLERVTHVRLAPAEAGALTETR